MGFQNIFLKGKFIIIKTGIKVYGNYQVKQINTTEIMNSDLKKHELLKLLSIQRQNNKTPLGIPFEDILNSMNIDKKYLDFISGELYGSEEIKHFEDYQYKKGLSTTEIGVSVYSSEKYIKRNNDRKWKLVRNIIAVITLLFTIFIQIRYCQPNEEQRNTQSSQERKIEDIETKQSEKIKIQEKELYIENSKDSLKNEGKS